MSYCYMAFHKMKSNESLTESMDHNYRKYDVLNADPSKKDLNKELVPLRDESYVAAVERRIAESVLLKSRKPRSDAIRALEFMLTYTGKPDEKYFDQERWEQKNVEWLNHKFGEENVMSVMCHYDETTPHIHAIVVPMSDGCLNASAYINGRDKCGRLLTDYAQAMSEFGLERGLEYSGAKHESVKRFYTAVNRSLEQELPAVEEGETAMEYRDRANEVYKDSWLQRIEAVNEEKKNTKKVNSKLAKTSIALKETSLELKELKKQFAMQAKELERLRAKEELDAETIKTAAFFNDVLSGLKNNVMSPEERKVFSDKLHEIVKWERARVQEKSKEADVEDNENR